MDAMNRIWHPVEEQGRTFTGCLNSEMLRLDSKYGNCLPNLRSARTLLLGSDYSGESTGTAYLVFSFLLTSLDSWALWEPERISVRREHLTDSRRMSFKRLGDGQRRRALIPLLKAADRLEGLSFSIALHKKCESLFAARPPLDLSNPDFSSFRKWKVTVLEKAFFVVHVLSVLLGGLAAPGQNVMWFTDEDSIAANDERVSELTNLFAWISSQYLKFNLGHCRCGTSRCDDGSRQIEDFLAIPDMIAGAIAEQMQLRNGGPSEFSTIFWMHRGDFSDKTRDITWWLSSSQGSLKRLVCMIDPTDDGISHLLSWFCLS
jgi:hypothetical protein